MPRGTYRVMPRGAKEHELMTWTVTPITPCGRADEHTRYDRRAAPPRPPRMAAPDRHTLTPTFRRLLGIISQTQPARPGGAGQRHTNQLRLND